MAQRKPSRSRASSSRRTRSGGSSARQTINVDGRTLRVTNLDKVLYPSSGTTKSEVIGYWQAVAPAMIPHIAQRPATRKRWPDGVGTEEKPGTPFFRKNLEDSAPDWVPRMELEHADHTNVYPLVNEPAVLAWFGQVAALEVHVPQWRFGADGVPQNPDRLVLDLDPGPGTGLAECARVARWCREILDDMGLACVPVSSGSKGLHLYASLDGGYTSDQVSDVAHELARSLEADHPDEVVSEMRKASRQGKVFIDWSQNSRSKTTVAPYSLRGRFRPNVAAPRTWEELERDDLAQLDFREVMQRLAEGVEPLAGIGGTGSRGTARPVGATDSGASPRQGNASRAGSASTSQETSVGDALDAYRAKRDAGRTPEPVPDGSSAADAPRARDRAEASPGRKASGGENAAPIFVIQEHHARALHYDTRLQHHGVLVSWAVPKGPPLRRGVQRLAVQTEDHPMEYASFEGRIPKGEYGAGEVSIWDTGSVEIEKWEDGKIVAVLHGRTDGGLGGKPRRYALIRTDDEDDWIIRLTKEQPAAAAGSGRTASGPEEEAAASAARGSGRSSGRESRAVETGPGPAALPDPLRAPMLATPGTPADLQREDWAFEGKWDGYRVIAGVGKDRVELRSRSGTDLAPTFPELAELAGLAAPGTVLDGEVVALGRGGRPDFGRLQLRGRLTKEKEIEQMRARIAVHYMVFDVLHTPAQGSLLKASYSERRAILQDSVTDGDHVHVPGDLGDSLEGALATSEELGLEGVLAKRAGSRYRPGRRSRDWIKIKHENHQAAVVIGWRQGKGGRARSLGSLLLAIPGEDGALRYAGRVGTGFGSAELDELRARLEKMKRKTPPAADVPHEDASDATWVSPKLVGEVKHSGRTRDGRLRQPVWRGLRPDTSPGEIEWEST